MGLLGKIKAKLKSNFDGLFDRAQDPRKEVEQQILDLEKDLRAAKAELTSNLASEKRMEAEGLARVAELKKWHERAIFAVRQGNDDLARKALEQKKIIEDEVKVRVKELREQRTYTDELEISLKQFEQKLSMLKTRRGTVAAGIGNKRRGSPMAGAKTAQDEFDRLSQKLDEDEAASGADQEAEDALRGGSRMTDAEVDKRLRDLGKADPLTELKRKMEREKKR
jgi:phage shock protein A